jgi:transcriptional regulator with XRE-family HTH domain
MPIIGQIDQEINVGQRLRELRCEHGLSIRALADLSNLNVNTLSLIENGKTSPSVSTLQQAAIALKVPITAFFETKTIPQTIIFNKGGHRQEVRFTHGTMTNLGTGISRQGLEPFIVTLEPGADSGDIPIVHTGLEFVFCLEGSIYYEVDKQTFILEPGDSLLFEAYLPHLWHNPGDAPSRSLLLLCSADERDNPDQMHFSFTP